MKRLIIAIVALALLSSLAIAQMPYSKSYYNYTNFGKIQAYLGTFDSVAIDTLAVGSSFEGAVDVIPDSAVAKVDSAVYADSITTEPGNAFTVDSLVSDTLFISVSGTQLKFLAD